MADSTIWKIVLIDDEPDIRDVVSIVLEDAGFSVFTARDGETGLSLCKEKHPQILITDIRMPGMDGIQVLRSAKQDFPDIEVIVVTAFGQISLAVEALQLDASDFITKPVNEDNLLVALERAKQRYSSRKELKDYTRFLEKEKAKTARQLMKTYALQKNLIESSMDGILACDENDCILLLNQSMEKMLGVEKKEVLEQQDFRVLFEKDRAESFKKALKNTGYGGEHQLFLYETEMRSKSGAPVPVQVSAATLWEAGVPCGWVGFFRDLRRIRRLERELADQATILHQDKMMSLGRLSASVVHEINNPLFGVLNYAKLMKKVLARGELLPESIEKFKKYLDLVQKETDRCSNIVSNLLTFSRKSEQRFSQVDLKTVLDKCILLSRHKLELSHIRLQSRVEDQTPQINGDANQLQQCMINLIFNAIDAMPDGGTLTLELGFHRDTSQVVMSVQDTGTGIQKEHFSKIFEPFFTTKKEGYGVGLGLSTVFGIIEHHKGKITVDSEPGNTVFRITLPV